jgi:hypothetical protein
VTRLLPLLGLLIAGAAHADPLTAPRLAAASNFGQTWAPEMLDAAEAFGLTDLRDEVYWRHVEVDGRDSFDWTITQYPPLLAARGIGLTAIVGDEHPAHDDGVTPHSPEAVAAFASYAARLASRFPAIDAIEVGNEMNTDDFTSGPMREADIAGRARLYTALLRATQQAVKAARPEVRIIGGAALAVPLAWFGALSEAGAPALMDTLALHPYTTAPEQFRRQIALLRLIPGFETIPIEATEFGTPDPAQAAAHLMKFHCQMALSGVARAVWYPLNTRGDGMAPLVTPEGSATDVGETFQLLQGLTGLVVTDAAPDPFTYACQFGPRALVIWGAARAVTLTDPALAARDPTGQPAAPLLSRDAPLLIVSNGAVIRLGDNVRLAPHGVVADSFDQFAYPGQPGDGFTRFARVDGAVIPFILGPGQQTNGVPWTPYFATPHDGMLRMDAEFLMPSTGEIVHAFDAPRAMTVTLEATLAPVATSRDGMVLSARLNGEALAEWIVTAREVLTLPGLALAEGDRLEIIVGPGATPDGDDALYRFTLREAG